MMKKHTIVAAAMFICNTGYAENCASEHLKGTIDTQRLWTDFNYLASDKLGGREVGTEGNFEAQSYLRQAYEAMGLSAFAPGYSQPFVHRGAISEVAGTNIIGWQSGSKYPDQFIVVTAHFDHLGHKGKHIYSGADDNASGVAGMLALAREVHRHPLHHSVIFVATDAEEKGLYGAEAFVAAPPVALSSIRYNLNLDMISYAGSGRKLYIAGGTANPKLTDVIAQAQTNASLCLVEGHNGSRRSYNGQHSINWRRASDHYPFLKQGIPYLFLSVADHRFYHTRKDTVAHTDKDFYFAAVETSLATLRALDR